MQYIAFDSHKRYTFASVEDTDSNTVIDTRIDHERGALTDFLQRCERGSPVAVETVGNWYWIVEEIEAAGMKPKLVHARKAKMMLASSNKTGKLDAHGMNKLQRTGTLPTVWIPDTRLRDTQELFRTRMVFSRQLVRMKNRVHATLAKYGIRVEQASDLFTQKGRAAMQPVLDLLPEQTLVSVREVLYQIDALTERIHALEGQIDEVFQDNESVRLLRTIPGIGRILSIVLASEIGDVNRFPSASHLAAYAGTTPRVNASGGKYRYGRAPADTNHYLKWAYCEAANTITQVRRRLRLRHAVRLYERVRARKGHSVAVGAVSRHLAEASYWVLKKKEPYKEPTQNSEAVSSSDRVSATVS